MDITNLLNLQGEMFLLLMLGAVLRKIKVLTEEAKPVLTDLVLYVVLPCNIMNSFRTTFEINYIRDFVVTLLVALAIQVACMILSRLLYNRESDPRKRVLQYATLASNAGFMGNPIAEGVFGAVGLMYGSIYLIPQRVVMWSAGLSCFTEGEDTRTIVRKVLLHPCIIAVYIGFFLMLTQFPLPVVIGDTITKIGSANTFLSMLLIGTIFADIRWRDLINFQVIRYTAIRLVLIPLITYIGCRLAGVSPIITGVSVLLSGMPAASMTAILAAKYNGDHVFAIKCVLFSTLMTMVTVPLWCLVL